MSFPQDFHNGKSRLLLANLIETAIKGILSKGFGFAIPPKQLDYSNFMTEFGLLYRSALDLSIATEEKDRIKTRLEDIVSSSFNVFIDNFEFENNLFAEKINSLKALMRNKDIIIQKADEGNNIVITDNEKYIEGVKHAISDFNKFIQLNITPAKYLNYIINVEKKFKQ